MWLNKLPWFAPRDRPIGIDVGSDGVRMLQMRQTSGQPLAVVSAIHRPLPEALDASNPAKSIDAAAEVIRQALEVGGFTRGQAVVSIPDAMVKVRTIRVVPGASGALINTPELRAAFPFPIDEAALRIFDAGLVGSGDRRASEIIAAATPIQLVQSWSAALSRAGVRVVSLQVRPWALFMGWLRGAAGERPVDEGATQAILEMGAMQSQLVMARGSRITFVRTIDIGSRLLDEAVARKVGATGREARRLQERPASSVTADDASDPVQLAVYDAVRGPLEELATEIARCIRYHSVVFRGERPTRLTLCGDAARHVHLRRILPPIIAVPAEPAPGFANVDVSRMKPAEAAGGLALWAAPFGLSMGEPEGLQSQPQAA